MVNKEYIKQKETIDRLIRYSRPYDIKNYVLCLIVYKYLSKKEEKFLREKFNNEPINLKKAYNESEDYQDIKIESEHVNGYFINPDYLFNELVNKAKKDELTIETLELTIFNLKNSLNKNNQNKSITNILEDLNFNSSRLGKTLEEKNKTISEIILRMSTIQLTSNNAGDIFEYIISKYSQIAGKKAGEFYTPHSVSEILAKIVTHTETEISTVYDPTCGSGSSLLELNKYTDELKFYGEELNSTTYNMSLMNMIMHNIKSEDFDIKLGDSLEDKAFKNQQFNAIVANPPFSAKWSSSKKFQEDPRFAEYGKLPPKSKADYAFVLHMIYHLKDNGTMAVVLPHGVLFRGAAEEKIRKHLIEEKNYIDAIIGLPSNLFYGTGIPTIIMVLKKDRKEDDSILFIDASQEYMKVRRQNKLREQDIDKIVNTYQNRKEIDKYSHKATQEEIKENDYNLNIPRYVDTFEEGDLIDLKEISEKLIEANKKLDELDEKIEKQSKKLKIEGLLH
ncbi:MAG: type I restriction-modification system subunit M [Methanosphaera sp. SHI1033]|jgi:type I restriction enzyme M protein|uniref:type I restriction-modification system subunit M n=1 Tax=Candidatus Methanosphaera massiliense TaxID=3017187 RepID=UPI000DC40584|nr:type I restriction-modification system subunit M [Candidatus Methanosphaera massiliense]MDE4078416.1 type I restriction-modification system subunit M [Candidatus Methanosphaera massiliense]RAP43539.1 MAG: type I restriction-modification system subunit M [Methanosphaera sp. SHI1033]